MTPNATNITPDQRERPVVRAGRWDAPALSSRRNSPKRLTAKPTPIKPSPVRIHARKVLSAAKYTLGSCSAGFSMEGLYLHLALLLVVSLDGRSPKPLHDRRKGTAKCFARLRAIRLPKIRTADVGRIR